MREKLIELLIEADLGCIKAQCHSCGHYDSPKKPNGIPGCAEYRAADYLIQNGVTIQKWIPVTERLPEELQKDNCAWSERVRPSVDVLVKIRGLKSYQTAWYSYSYKEWVDVREEHSFDGVTHWMLLPSAEVPK